jgi:hypothetical protein
MISTYTASERRFDAVQQLQERRDQLPPGSFKQRAAEHAIDLALSPNRSVSEHLADDALDNAEYILGRKKQRSGLVPRPGDDVVQSSNLPTPLEEVGYESFLKELVARSEEIHEYGRTVLSAMLLRERVSRTAERIDVSESIVVRIRASIREEAKKICARRGGGADE